MKTGARPLFDDPGSGDQEPRFRIVAELGEGGMAKVHLAVARGPSGFNKLVVLKALRPNHANDPDCLEMFQHEARLAARLNHPNVVQTYEVTSDGERQVIVMEYLEGQSLSRIVVRAREERRLPLAMHLRILCDALAGLHYAHELRDFDGARLQLVHRDVSPQNVFVTFEGQVKILDFGIAKAAIASPPETDTGVLKGKVPYMAPEQMAGAAVDRRADIFSVGAMLWEALAGQRIWAGLPELVIMQKLSAGAIPSPRAIDPSVPEQLETICLKAMSIQPEARFQNARQFEMALESAIAQLNGAVRQRDIGTFVADLFADTRAEIRAVIESQMNRATNLSSREFSAVSPVSLYGLVHTSNGAGAVASGPGSGWSGRLRSRLTVVFLVLIGVFGGFAMLVWRGSLRGASATRSASTPALSEARGLPLATASGELTGSVQLGIAAVPSQARLFFDEQALASNPYVLAPSVDRLTHRVRAEAPGYAAQTVEVTLERSTALRIVLEQVEGGASAKTRPAASLRTSPAAPLNRVHVSESSDAAGAPSSRSSCVQPYYFDERGIKKIRVECL